MYALTGDFYYVRSNLGDPYERKIESRADDDVTSAEHYRLDQEDGEAQEVASPIRVGARY